MNNFKHTIYLTLVILSLPEISFAGIVNYNESVDGELGFASTTFIIDAEGINTVSGHSTQNGFIFDNDTFFLKILPSLEITSISLSLSNGIEQFFDYNPNMSVSTLPDNTILTNAIYDITNNNLVIDDFFNYTPPPPPYGPGDYRISLGAGVFGPWPQDAFASFDWNISLDIKQKSVPEPASLLLLAIGMAGFGISKLRK